MLKRIQQVIEFIINHKKSVAIVSVSVVILCIISHIMTIRSIVYHPLSNSFPTASILPYETQISYVKSTTYRETASPFSVALDSIASVNKTFATIMDTIDIASRLNDVNGKSGSLVIPKNASYASFDGNCFYGWKKEYACCFNQIPHAEVVLVFMTAQYAISIQFGGGFSFFAEIGLYQLT